MFHILIFLKLLDASKSKIHIMTSAHINMMINFTPYMWTSTLLSYNDFFLLPQIY